MQKPSVSNNDNYYYEWKFITFIEFFSVTKKDEKSDSFVEKLAMQIVKNLQVTEFVAAMCIIMSSL